MVKVYIRHMRQLQIAKALSNKYIAGILTYGVLYLPSVVGIHFLPITVARQLVIFTRFPLFLVTGTLYLKNELYFFVQIYIYSFVI